MFRSAVSRGLVRSAAAAASKPQQLSLFRTQLSTLAPRRPQILAATTISRLRYNTTKAGGLDGIDAKREAKIGEKPLSSHPELVSSSSSTHGLMSELGVEDPAKQKKANDDDHDTDMMAGVKSDIRTIRETFSMQDVPKEAYYMGLAGVIPYAATSLSTVFCAYEIHTAAEQGTGFLMTGKTAEALLHVIEPIQVGYGAVIISFLGAIHWGLEFAKYGGQRGYPRYSIGVAAAALAWPTTMLPVESALISQFLVFNWLYYADSRATRRGWAPAWYGVYRFVLTFIVGAAIVVSLMGRGQIADQIDASPGHVDRIQRLRALQGEEQVEEEEARRKYLGDKAADEDEEEEEEEEEGEEKEEKEDDE